MENTSVSKNPYQKDLLICLAATVAVFALLAFLRQMQNMSQSVYHMISLMGLGSCAYKLAENLVCFFTYRKCAKQSNGRSTSKEEFQSEQRASGFISQPKIMIVTALLLFSLLTMQSFFGSISGTGEIAWNWGKKVSMDELVGYYQVTEIKGDDQASMYFSLMKMLGINLFMEIDEEGYGTYGTGGAAISTFRFYPDKMLAILIQDGEETDQGGRFTLKNGMLTINNKMIMKKITEEEFAALTTSAAEKSGEGEEMISPVND